MPAYNFKERFVPMLLDGTKPHTVRSRRKHPVRVGHPLYLYYGMRTKWCRRLRSEECLKTHSIYIGRYGVVLIFSDLLHAKYTGDFLVKYKMLATELFHNADGEKVVSAIELSNEQKNRFAWLDGFRPEGSTLENPEGAFDAMYAYWSKENQLPYVGDVIYWSLAYAK